jgi:hypothetical protein
MCLNATTVAKVLMVTLADYLDQMVEVNGWRDHHQVASPLNLYPGIGRPAVALYWITAICAAIRDVVDVIPTAFDHCTATVSYDAEVQARDKYWSVVAADDDEGAVVTDDGEGETKLAVSEQVQLLTEAVQLNPIIAEPHVLLAQLAFRVGNYTTAAIQAKVALQKFYSLATAWDKRCECL